ncbi:MAG: hypothetical protein JWL90_554 [Chthoniobacteraceae bacterium]|nr:hypothetical protein [Chthoniobacteraceae bacterium]
MKRFRLLVASLCTPLCLRAADADSVADWREKMQPITPRGYVSHYTAVAIDIDGKLDDAAWAGAAWTDDFADIEGMQQTKPRFRTRAKLLWDDNYLYVAAEMEEPHLWATLKEHDSVIFHDPDFEVFIDPDGSAHNYYEFEMNALNTGWDLFLPKPYKDGGSADNSWEIPGLKTAVHLRGTLNNPADTDQGWSVEMAFPWKVLAARTQRAAPPKEGDQWRLGFSRVEWQVRIADGKYEKLANTPEDNWVWSPQGVIDMHRPERWGYVQFSREPDARFVPDTAAPARDILQEVYYAQRAFKKKNGRWGATLGEIGVAPGTALNFTATGWEAAIDWPVSNGGMQKWKIRSDARIDAVHE